MLRLSKKEFEKLMAERGLRYEEQTVVNTSSKPNTKSPKYRNRKVYVYSSGVYYEKNAAYGRLLEKYDSEIEYRRSQELALLQQGGKISHLQRQIQLLIQPGFKRQGKTVRAIYYVADFKYRNEAGQVIIEDVKGFDMKTGKFRTTQDFRLKWKLLKSLYPEYIFALYGQNGICYE